MVSTFRTAIRRDSGSRRTGLRKADSPRSRIKLKLTLADFEKGQEIEYPEGIAATKFDIANACLETDGIISLPKMKTHQLTRITGSIKNQFGCVYGLNKAAFHLRVPNQVQFSKMLIDLHHLLKMRLFIMDGVQAMEGNGPRNGTPVKMNCIIISADPIAVDATFCRMVDLDPEFVPTITYGNERGVGNYKTADIEYVGDDPSQFKNASYDVVRKPVVNTSVKRRVHPVIGNIIFPRPVIDPKLCVKCGVCVESCPVEGKAVQFKDGNKKNPPAYTYEKCIRCYCCQELCPYKAISVKQPFFGKILASIVR